MYLVNVSICSQYYLNPYKKLSIQESSFLPLEAVSNSSHVGTSKQGLLRLLSDVQKSVVVLQADTCLFIVSSLSHQDNHIANSHFKYHTEFPSHPPYVFTLMFTDGCFQHKKTLLQTDFLCSYRLQSLFLFPPSSYFLFPFLLFFLQSLKNLILFRLKTRATTVPSFDGLASTLPFYFHLIRNRFTRSHAK